MEEPRIYTEAEAERFFAINYFNKIWGLLEKPDRTRDEDELMLDYAHASLAHWRAAGTPLNLQRGIWMLSRVHSVLGQSGPALAYANHCQDLTEQHDDLMQDFDKAFAFEALARAHALAGKREEAEKYLCQAEEAGNLIQDDEDRKIFQADLNDGNWYGLK
jgi:hypothetical protein